ncbi:MAG TPA: TetR/AcrR family transcriptional regulator [Micropepsaceae bacterium]|nr:TetR/AcrR family transcriptional regulator [Micropepsaceae bacterium]
MKTVTKKEDMPPRERILDAARELFYTRGIRCVSVDDIAAAAQTNKMTLYRHFESKDRLVAEYLKSLNAYAIARDEEAQRAHPGDAYAQLRELIARVGNDLCAAELRGCPMANAAVEFPESGHPAREVIEDSKKQQCERLVRMCREAGYEDPEQLGEELFLLFEGACVNVQSQGRCGPGSRFTKMANALLDSRLRHLTK